MTRKRPTQWHVVAACLLLCSLPFAAANADTDRSALLQSLRDGGYTLYFRHAATDWSQQDQVQRAGDWRSCDAARMRQLSAAGRQTAREVGNAIRALGIPVAKVYASPYCRTMETAALLNLGDVVPSDDVINLRVADFFGGREQVIATARALLATPPPPGGNVVVVAHGNVARDATPVYPGEAEAVVFQPRGDGEFSVLARIPSDQWDRLQVAD